MNFRQEAYSTILKVLKDHDFSDTLLQQKAKKLKNSEESLALFYTTVKGVVKLHRKLDYILTNYTDARKWAATDIKIKTMLYLGLYQLIYLTVFVTIKVLKKFFNFAASINIFFLGVVCVSIKAFILLFSARSSLYAALISSSLLILAIFFSYELSASRLNLMTG